MTISITRTFARETGSEQKNLALHLSCNTDVEFKVISSALRTAMVKGQIKSSNANNSNYEVVFNEPAPLTHVNGESVSIPPQKIEMLRRCIEQTATDKKLTSQISIDEESFCNGVSNEIREMSDEEIMNTGALKRGGTHTSVVNEKGLGGAERLTYQTKELKDVMDKLR